jgi:uncharacterized protein (TIGR02246 family)
MPGLDRAVAQRTAERYVGAVNLGDAAAVAALFTDDAEALHPSRGHHKGIDAIRAFYEDGLRHGPHLEIRTLAVDGELCVMEVIGSSASTDTRQLVIDHFTLADDGRIMRNALFLGPTP